MLLPVEINELAVGEYLLKLSVPVGDIISLVLLRSLTSLINLCLWKGFYF